MFVLYIFAFAIMAVFWLGVALAGRAVLRAVRARRRVRAAVFTGLIAALLWGGLFAGFTPGSELYSRYRFTKSLFGRGFLLASPRSSYDSDRSFNGDGESSAVYAMSAAMTRWAAAPPPELKTGYPLLPWGHSGWSVVKWRQTPVSPEDRELLERALSLMNRSLENRELLEQLASEPGNSYACFYEMRGGTVGSFEFFLLSPAAGVFITAKSIT